MDVTLCMPLSGSVDWIIWQVKQNEMVDIEFECVVSAIFCVLNLIEPCARRRDRKCLHHILTLHRQRKMLKFCGNRWGFFGPVPIFKFHNTGYGFLSFTARAPASRLLSKLL